MEGDGIGESITLDVTRPLDRKFHLRAPIEAVSALGAAGVNVVGIANNHAMDFGAEALLD